MESSLLYILEIFWKINSYISLFVSIKRINSSINDNILFFNFSDEFLLTYNSKRYKYIDLFSYDEKYSLMYLFLSNNFVKFSRTNIFESSSIVSEVIYSKKLGIFSICSIFE